MKKRILVTLLTMAMVATLFAGCGNSASETKEETKAETKTEETSEVSKMEGPATEKTQDDAPAVGKKYGVVLKTLSSEFWQTMQKGIEEKAKELGVEVEVLGANSEDDVEGQVNVFETMIQSGEYIAFAVAPLSDANLINTIAEANQAGYLVADIDERVNPESLEAQGGSVISFVTTDNEIVGNTAGNYIASLLQSGDEVAIIEGKSGVTSGEARIDGVKAAFEKAGLTIVDSQPADWDKTKAYDLATNLINKNENLKAIYCCNDTMAMGAEEAVINSGKDIIVVGTDGNSDAIASVKEGKLTATVAQDPGQVGARSLELLVQAYNNGEKPGDKEMIDERIDPILVTETEN
ncbi:MAG: D-allose transporter substrate-binding protein [Lachnospiraceae bacterium]|nr:D-allose transporter substrate-binding protein [Lachnospiraceae bacterium]